MKNKIIPLPSPIYLFCLILLSSVLFLIAAARPAGAAPVVGFNAGNIIDDSVFTNKDSMTPDDIQRFLNSKVPTCDTWGTQPSEFGGGTRAQWGSSRGYPPPYTCLKSYSENGKSAAQIIHSVAQQFRINPQVLIVLLQKEQSLVTDTWPLSSQYRTATGYGCPDTAPCDSQYYGLTNQLTWAGRMFNAILTASPTWYTPYVLGNNFIRWSPNSACGGSTVNIQNRSTQALYNYTPYQPNQAALNAGWGTGDACSAYGNRNFYMYFTSWFGTVRSNDSLMPHPDGTVISMSGGAYLIQGGARHLITSGPVFESHGYRWQDVKPATTGDRNLSDSWPVDFIKPGMLYTGDPSGVYVTASENGQWVRKHVSYTAFVNLGYNWNQVRAINSLFMPQAVSASPQSAEQHPDGTLIKDSQGSVYMIDHGTRRYVSAAVFNTYRWDWNSIMPETPSDKNLPLGANMLMRQGAIISDGSNLYVVQLPASGAEIKRPIGPWSCYANVFRYTMADVTQLSPSALPAANGSLVTC